MDCEIITTRLLVIKVFAAEAGDALGNGDNTTIRDRLNEIEDRIKKIRAELDQ